MKELGLLLLNLTCFFGTLFIFTSLDLDRNIFILASASAVLACLSSILLLEEERFRASLSSLFYVASLNVFIIFLQIMNENSIIPLILFMVASFFVFNFSKNNTRVRAVEPLPSSSAMVGNLFGNDALNARYMEIKKRFDELAINKSFFTLEEWHELEIGLEKVQKAAHHFGNIREEHQAIPTKSIELLLGTTNEKMELLQMKWDDFHTVQIEKLTKNERML